MKKSVISLLTLLALVGCQEAEKSSVPKSSRVEQDVTDDGSGQTLNAADLAFKITKKRSIELASDLSNIDDFVRSLNRHTLTVSTLRGRLAGGKVLCTKDTAMSSNTEVQSTFSALGTQASLELQLERFDTAEVAFKCEIRDAQEKVLKTFEESIRKGHVVERSQNIQALSSNDIDTLVIRKGAELFFENTKSTLRVRTLVSEEGVISTFPVSELSKTEDNTNGEDGGALRLEVDEAIGYELTINLRGKNAGKQTKVPARPARAAQGRSGNCRENRCSGDQGAPGLPARNGFPGYVGGRTGFAEVKIKKKTDLEVIFSYRPGLGSAGGAPGEPGEGGPGGEADSMLVQDICGRPGQCRPYSLQGDRGPTGVLGPAGAVGERGRDGIADVSSFVNLEESQDDRFAHSWSSRRGDL